MPNNFKLTGDYYVSKAGNDSNNGLTPETPKRTIQAVLSLVTPGNRTVIVGAGVYRESVSVNYGSLTLNIRADGQVVFEGNGVNQFDIGSTSVTINIYGIIFRNYDFISHRIISVTGSTINYIQCYLYCKLTSTTIVTTFSSCFLIGTTLYLHTSSASNSIIGSVIINSLTLLSNFGTIKDCYILSSILATSVFVTTTNFNYNNIQGFIIMNVASTVTSGVVQDAYGRYYDLSIATSTGDGTIGNPYGRPYTLGAGFNFTNHRIAYPTFNVNSFSSDPKFNNILKQDFSLQPDSPHIARASNFIDNIGGTPVATRLNASGSTFSGSNATVDSLVFAPFSDYVISGSAVTGSVTSAPIFISSSAKVIQEIDYNGLLAFNKDTTAPTGSNVNVPDVLTYTSASNQPGANPDRLTYYMRWTTGSSQPVSDAQWENGGLWPAGSFNVFEWNTKPSVDFLGRGNGDQNFSIVNTPTFVRATWIQLRVSLRNNYLI